MVLLFLMSTRLHSFEYRTVGCWWKRNKLPWLSLPVKGFQRCLTFRIHAAIEISRETLTFPLGAEHITWLHDGQAALSWTSAACSSMQIGADANGRGMPKTVLPIIPSYYFISMCTSGRGKVELNSSTVNNVLCNQVIMDEKQNRCQLTPPPQGLCIHVVDASATVAILLFLNIDQPN